MQAAALRLQGKGPARCALCNLHCCSTGAAPAALSLHPSTSPRSSGLASRPMYRSMAPVAGSRPSTSGASPVGSRARQGWAVAVGQTWHAKGWGGPAASLWARRDEQRQGTGSSFPKRHASRGNDTCSRPQRASRPYQCHPSCPSHATHPWPAAGRGAGPGRCRPRAPSRWSGTPPSAAAAPWQTASSCQGPTCGPACPRLQAARRSSGSPGGRDSEARRGGGSSTQAWEGRGCGSSRGTQAREGAAPALVGAGLRSAPHMRAAAGHGHRAPQTACTPNRVQPNREARRTGGGQAGHRRLGLLGVTQEVGHGLQIKIRTQTKDGQTKVVLASWKLEGMMPTQRSGNRRKERANVCGARPAMPAPSRATLHSPPHRHAAVVRLPRVLGCHLAVGAARGGARGVPHCGMAMRAGWRAEWFTSRQGGRLWGADISTAKGADISTAQAALPGSLQALS